MGEADGERPWKGEEGYVAPAADGAAGEGLAQQPAEVI